MALRAESTHPLGEGDAATNLASSRLSGTGTLVTDNDVSDVFVSLGVLGGVAYLAVIVLVFRRVFSAYARSKDMLLLVIGGLLVVNLEHWLQGGYYAIAPLFWFVVGWACRGTPVKANRQLGESFRGSPGSAPAPRPGSEAAGGGPHAYWQRERRTSSLESPAEYRSLSPPSPAGAYEKGFQAAKAKARQARAAALAVAHRYERGSRAALKARRASDPFVPL